MTPANFQITLGGRPEDIEGLRLHPDLYDGAIAYVDHAIGELIAAPEDLGIAEETVIPITSDHGEPPAISTMGPTSRKASRRRAERLSSACRRIRSS